jgi:hypothetical protein
MTTITVPKKSVPVWQTKVANMLCNKTNKLYSTESLALNIWNTKTKYKNKMNLTRSEYINNYLTISEIISITEMFDYINQNYIHIFSFNKKNIKLLMVVQDKRQELDLKIQTFLKTKNFSRSQKKKVIIARKMLNIKTPYMCKEIGNVLNRLFITDIALNICEYI